MRDVRCVAFSKVVGFTQVAVCVHAVYIYLLAECSLADGSSNLILAHLLESHFCRLIKIHKTICLMWALIVLGLYDARTPCACVGVCACVCVYVRV